MCLILTDGHTFILSKLQELSEKDVTADETYHNSNERGRRGMENKHRKAKEALERKIQGSEKKLANNLRAQDDLRGKVCLVALASTAAYCWKDRPQQGQSC